MGVSALDFAGRSPAPEGVVELRDATRKLMADTEQATGCPVVVTEDSALTMMSGVLMAAPNRPGHIIRIHPKAPAAVDYYVAYYCRMIQRFFENPPEERSVFGYGDKGRYQVRKLLEHVPVVKRLGDVAILAMCEQLLTGLMTHLRSIPLGLRLDHWIFTEHPELAEMQKNAIQPQLQENNRSAGDKFRSVCPPQVFDATMAINAAFAQFWAEKWNQPELALPYKASGYAVAGERLLKILQDVPDSGRTDRALIDAWGAELNLKNWYVWVPYQGPQHA
jgi:hemoglobin-like flavoprotein